jgi:hypothetical protein
MKNYLISLINKAMEVKHQDERYYTALEIFIDECTHFEKQFNQFDTNSEDELEDAISLLCCLPLVLAYCSRSERDVLMEAIRMQVPSFAEVIIFNRQFRFTA